MPVTGSINQGFQKHMLQMLEEYRVLKGRVTGLVVEALWASMGRLPPKGRRNGWNPRWWSEEKVRAMYADYRDGKMMFVEVARKHGVGNPASVRQAFKARGWKLYARRNRGQFRKERRHTDEEVLEIIGGMKDLVVPPALKNEWRDWDIGKRGWFIAQARARLRSPHDRPDLPFSTNVIPFDYTTPEARAIVEARTAGKPSRDWDIEIKIKSQGVIWDGRLWFWSRKAGYTEGVRWTPERGRPLLHHVIWERTHGRSVPADGVIRFADGNPNNLSPENLILMDRNDVARENQAAALRERSRKRTEALLSLVKKKGVQP
jgi:transposase-like protein